LTLLLHVEYSVWDNQPTLVDNQPTLVEHFL